jgi:hypothetical protein
MRTFIKPLTAAAGASILALGMSAAPALAAPASSNGLSPSVTVTSASTPEQSYKTGVAIQILDGEDKAIRPQGDWSCGLLRLDGHVASTPSKDNHYKSSWRVAVGASYALPHLTITMPDSSSTGIGWKIPDQKPVFGDKDGDVSDLPATNTHPEYNYIDKDRVTVEGNHGEVVIAVPGGLQPGEYFNVEFDSELEGTPKVGSEYVNELKTDQNCATPDAPKDSSTSVGGKTEQEDCYKGRTPDGKQCDGRHDEKCEEGKSPNGEPCDGRHHEKCEEGMTPDGKPCDYRRKHPVKVNSGGENDSTGGLIALGLGAAVIGGAAAYGLRRSKKS